MYGNTMKQAKAKLIASLILSIATSIFIVVMGSQGYSIAMVLLCSFFAVIIETFAWFGILLNWKRFFLGIIKPIPIISMLIEFFKGYGMAFATLFWIVKNGKNEL